MRFNVMSFRIPRLGAPPAAAPSAPDVPPGLAGDDDDIGHPTAESQQAGLDHLMRIAMEQAAGLRPAQEGLEAPGAFPHI